MPNETALLDDFEFSVLAVRTEIDAVESGHCNGCNGCGGCKN
jgi:hypothetical protein